jgi:hypothetical protein
MNKQEAIELIKQGRPAEWNAYRKAHPDWVPDLSNTDLSGLDLVPNNIPFDLSRANLCSTIFPGSSQYLIRDLGIWEGTRLINLKGSIINSKTRFPSNFNSAQYGTILVSDTDPRANAVLPVVFISYAWVNGDVVLAIDQWLRLKNIRTKLDRRDFFAGSRIRDEIMRVMQECDVTLIFYSQQSKDKPWTQFESEFAKDLEMHAKIEKRNPPRIIYIVLDDVLLPSVTDRQKLAVTAKGKRFELVCEEIYHHILQLPRSTEQIDLSKWSNYTF